ncbi:MAG: hypothetical protein WD407_01970 [Rhodospirillales bacterium]
MKKSIVVLALSFLLGGCALPTSIQIASWAIDGISYIATKKSMTDHGISLARSQDCALWRVVKQDEVCVDYRDTGTALAAKVADNKDQGLQEVQVASLADHAVVPAARLELVDTTLPVSEADIARLADFETAAGAQPDSAPQADKAQIGTRQKGYSAATFGAAWAEASARAGDALKSLAPRVAFRKPLTGPIDVGRTGPSFRVGGYAANTIAAAWNFQQGKTRPSVRWIMAESPAPQQHRAPAEAGTVIAEAPSEAAETVRSDSAERADLSESHSHTQDSGLVLSNNTLKKINKLSLPSSRDFTGIDAGFETLAVEPPMTSADTETGAGPESNSGDKPLQHARAADRSVYFVISSHGDQTHATKTMSYYRALNVQLAVGHFDGRKIYRGLVGPFALGEMGEVERRIARAGVRNAWAIRLDRSHWSFVYTAAVSDKLALRH